MNGLRFTRRGLLKAGGATALAVGAGGALATQQASAAVPASKRFDLSKPSYDVFRGVLLHEKHHSMQGMAYDAQNGHLFIIQARDGATGDDLCINRLSLSGKVTGSMHINNAGHGVSIGVEPRGSDSYLWVECDSHKNDGSGRGTALARFKFVNGKSPSGVKKFFKGSNTITCATDPVNKRILVRRKESGKFTLRLYDFASLDLENNTFTERLAKIAQPKLGNGKVTFQGYAVLGSYVYMLDGNGHANAADIDSYVSAVDLNTGKVVDRFKTKAGKSLVYREPEGMAITRTSGGKPRLVFGFSSRRYMGHIDRFANVFYKDVLI